MGSVASRSCAAICNAPRRNTSTRSRSIPRWPMRKRRWRGSANKKPRRFCLKRRGVTPLDAEARTFSRAFALEVEPHPQPSDPRLHDFPDLIEAQRPRKPRVVRLAEHRCVVEQIEYVEIDCQIRGPKLERLFNPSVKRRDHWQSVGIDVADEQHRLAVVQRVGGYDLAAIEGLRIALPRHEIRRQIDSPRSLVHPVRDELVLRQRDVDLALAAAPGRPQDLPSI